MSRRCDKGMSGAFRRASLCAASLVISSMLLAPVSFADNGAQSGSQAFSDSSASIQLSYQVVDDDPGTVTIGTEKYVDGNGNPVNQPDDGLIQPFNIGGSSAGALPKLSDDESALIASMMMMLSAICLIAIIGKRRDEDEDQHSGALA